MTKIILPYPPSDLNPNARMHWAAKTKERWTKAEDEQLSNLHGTMKISELAEVLQKSSPSVRARITRLGIAKQIRWQASEELALIELYNAAGDDGVLNLTEFAERVGRDKSNVCRKAKLLGLATNKNRRGTDNPKIRVPKFASKEERSSHTSIRIKEWHRKNQHPRGMAGKKHSPETIKIISDANIQRWEKMTKKEKEEFTLKAMKAKEAKTGTIAPNIKRGSWKAGWRIIGDRRNFYRSRWEANYARYLQWLKERGEIKDWAHEPETFWFEAIKRGVRSYKPDFRVWENDGSSALHEVKGWMDKRSKTALRRMKKYYPKEKLILIDGKQYRSIRIKVMSFIKEWEDSARDVHA